LAGNASLPVSIAELETLRRAVCERTSLESPELSRRMEALEGNDYRAVIESALQIVADAKPGALWVGCKEVWVLDFVPLLARTFTHARFYAIERDPRAVIASLLAMGERDPSQRAHAPSYMRHWRKNIALARRFSSDPALEGRFRAVPYERLVASAPSELDMLCDELGLPMESGMLNLSAEGWAGNSSFEHSDRNVYASSASRWRASLAPEVISATDFLCGPEMALTEYTVESGVDEGRVLEYLKRAATDSGSWRSDSGNVDFDFAGELDRHALLDGRKSADAELIRRCFLFPQTFEAIRAARRVAA
jgi:hypothetical protein